MLTASVIDNILATIPQRTIGVLGDLFLDRYLDLDASLTEPSIETGLDAYQVVRVRSYPGAAGTVINNLVALGVGRIVPISMIGDDGEGHELLQALRKMPSLDTTNLATCVARRTPTYTKPMLQMSGEPARELNRLDIKNRHPLPAEVEMSILRRLTEHWPGFDVLLVLDQVSEPECGVITTLVRERLADLAAHHPGKIVIVDSRERVGLFRNTWLKPNERECERVVSKGADLPATLREMTRLCNRPVFCTRGDKGTLVAESSEKPVMEVPGYAVTGPIDTVGAGDSSSAALACALASGADLAAAAAFANLIASITIQQIGVTGVATPEQVRERWRAVLREQPG
ncbi:MAG TPA: PfkB family carbohydrate kinase [Gemmataceae bacterium]|nr:PfkB family carbohydrate kinase [Gemmataceae bacterium]